MLRAIIKPHHIQEYVATNRILSGLRDFFWGEIGVRPDIAESNLELFRFGFQSVQLPLHQFRNAMLCQVNLPAVYPKGGRNFTH